MTISVYAVGIYFRKPIAFIPDGNGPLGPTMSGKALLAASNGQGLVYAFDLHGTIGTLEFTPTAADLLTHGPKATGIGLAGKTLVLSQTENKFPLPSIIFQYTSSIQPVRSVGTRPAFATNQFYDGADVRIRLLSIFEA